MLKPRPIGPSAIAQREPCEILLCDIICQERWRVIPIAHGHAPTEAVPPILRAAVGRDLAADIVATAA
ncbi:MAG: hypothetical protein IPO18_08360 [bacterium]|nr:hypothetical protein [bacterium]